MPEEIVFLSFTSIVAVTTIAFGIMRSINKRLDRKMKVEEAEGAVLRNRGQT